MRSNTFNEHSKVNTFLPAGQTIFDGPENIGMQEHRSDNSGKRCSIVFVGAENPTVANSHLRYLSAEQFPTEYELLSPEGSLPKIDGLQDDTIKGRIKTLKLACGLKFDQLCVESAKQAQGEYVLFANRPIEKAQIITAIQEVESSGLNIAVSPDKKNYIIVKRKTFIEAGSIKALLQKAEQQLQLTSDFNEGIEPQVLDTKPIQEFGFGQVLQISDRDTMLHLMPTNSTVAEVGAFKGGYSAKILDITRPSRLHLIDAWPGQTIHSSGEVINGYEAYNFVKERFSKEIEDNRVVLHRNFSVYASQRFENEYFDWIYIDAGHHYEEVKSDLNYWYPKVKDGGFITGHDYVEKKWYGIVRAVNEFIQQHPVVFVALTQEVHGSLSWILKKLPGTTG